MRLLFKIYFQVSRWLRLIYAPVTLGCRVMVVDDGRVLLVRMTYTSGWHLPGGGVRRSESFEQAAARELREESGLQAEKLSLIGLFFDEADHRRDHVAVYRVERYSGELKPDSREISEARFFPVSELPRDLGPGHRERMLEYFGQRDTSIEGPKFASSGNAPAPTV
jgi:ADP-ribose pyrophosphatase YjhB (NUDIX family)